MVTFLIIIGALFVVLILGLIYRVLNLVGIAKGNSNNYAGETTTNKVNAILFPTFFVLLFGSIVLFSPVMSEGFLPEAASVHGKQTDSLFWLTMAVICTAFLLTHILLFFFPFMYRYKKENKALYYPENNKLEIIWTVIPAIVMTLLVISGWWVWSDITKPAPADAVKLEIMGKQFNWQVRYPGLDGQLGRHDYKKIDATNSMGIDFTDSESLDDFIPREIHIPVNQTVALQIRARDVLHSVFMPHFRLKMDAVPGMPTNFAFVPTKTTAEMREELGDPNFNYELACTEVCGGSHYAMRMVIVVDSPEEFNTWYSEQQPWAAQNTDYLSSIGIDLETKGLATSK